MALDNTAKQELKAALAAIDPTRDDIIDMMVSAIEEWVKKATITVTIPDDIKVQVDLKTGNGRTLESVEVEGTLS